MAEYEGELWCQIELYNEYLKKISSLLTQTAKVQKCRAKAETEMEMLKNKNDSNSKKLYKERLSSTLKQCDERLDDILEELSLVQKLKEDMEEKVKIFKSQI